MKIRNKKTLLASCACLMAVAIGVGGTLAYLTDNETHTNTFTLAGNVKIDLTEPGWDETDVKTGPEGSPSDPKPNGIPDASEDLTPNGQVTKDPRVTNESDSDVIVFLRLTVPVKDVTKISDAGAIRTVRYTRSGETDAAWDGNGTAHTAQEIFYFKQASDTAGSHVNSFHPSWQELPGKEKLWVNGADRTASWSPLNLQGSGQRTYVFGYKNRIAKGVTTAALFDKVQLKNIIENEIAADQLQNIKVEAFAIQADNILSSGNPVNTAGTLSESVLAGIYEIYVEQNGEIGENGDMIYNNLQGAGHSSAEKEADVNNDLNLKGDGPANP